jgi:hypothetical protein
MRRNESAVTVEAFDYNASSDDLFYHCQDPTFISKVHPQHFLEHHIIPTGVDIIFVYLGKTTTVKAGSSKDVLKEFLLVAQRKKKLEDL